MFLGLILLGMFLGIICGQQFTLKHMDWQVPLQDDNGNEYTPQNCSKVQFVSDCPGAKKIAKESNDYMALRPAIKVFYPSKKGTDGQETVKIGAWWLPADEDKFGKKTPRVIVQHGNNVNGMDTLTMVPAYMLRAMGYSVLLTDLRDHGMSGKTSYHTVAWGWGYYLDVAGGWEYAVNDPDGVLGGPLPPSKVGIYGQSMGGFASSTAFGVEKEAAGLWIDSAVFRPDETLVYDVAQVVGGLLARAISRPAWQATKYFAGRDVEHTWPEDALDDKGKKRPVAVAQAQDDSRVSFRSGQQYVAHFEKMGYDLRVKLMPKVSICEIYTHLQMEYVMSEKYYNLLCGFWSYVFDDKDTDRCKEWPIIDPKAKKS